MCGELETSFCILVRGLGRLRRNSLLQSLLVDSMVIALWAREAPRTDFAPMLRGSRGSMELRREAGC